MESWDNEPTSNNQTHEKAQVKDKSLLQVLFETDVKSTEEQRHEIVKQAVNSIICQKALTLKEQIRREMDLVEAEERLKDHVEKLSINRNVLFDLQLAMPSADRKERESMRTAVTTITRGIRESMEKVYEIEHRIQCLKMCWEYFRTNCKDVIFDAISYQLYLSKNQEKSELQWTDFIPPVKLEKEKDAHRICYFE